MVSPKALEAVEWYSQNREVYKALAKKVESIIREILESNKINFHSITSRDKPISSYKRKAFEEGYEDPRSEIMDMAGVRIITYTDSDAINVAKLIEESFEINPEHSINKTEELGIDRVGYRSIHYIGTLGKDRSSLPENRIFKEMCFEIQIRTILQHAWAEFEHNRNYKFSGVLPTEIRRRFSILAGTLELLDREFDILARDIDEYILEVRETRAKIFPQLIFLDDFEIDDVGSTPSKWETTEENGGVVISSEKEGAEGTEKYVTISSPYNSRDFIRRNIDSINKIDISYYIRQEKYGKNKVGAGFHLFYENKEAIWLCITKGMLTYYDIKHNPICDIELGKWYKIQIKVDCTTGIFSCLINDKLLVPKGNFRNKVPLINMIRSTGWNRQDLWSTSLDQIRISKQA